jgi:hypothetical protein
MADRRLTDPSAVVSAVDGVRGYKGVDVVPVLGIGVFMQRLL